MQHSSINQQITFIYTHNLQISAHFYEKIIGFPLWLDQKTCRIYQITDSSLLGICAVSDSSKGKINSKIQENVILTLVTDEVNAWYKHLKKHGIVFEKPPETNTFYNIYHCFLRDPSGYLIEIQQFLPTE